MPDFATTKAAEAKLRRQLRKVARVVAGIIEAHTNGSVIADPVALKLAIEAYSKSLKPWAQRVVADMVANVSKSNVRAFKNHSKRIGTALRSELATSAVGAEAIALQTAQVELITSLPIKAAQRAQKLALEAASGGRRAAEVAVEIARTGKVTEARATMIARTEIAKVNSAITTARAQSVGATHYIWRTMKDGDVRDVHADLEGDVYPFADHPTIEGEGKHGPGDIWNCRCFAEPVLTEAAA